MSNLASHSPDKVESLTAWIGELVRERQDLRSGGADADMLERNRRRIVELHRDLAHALIERYHPQATAA